MFHGTLDNRAASSRRAASYVPGDARGAQAARRAGGPGQSLAIRP
jgi:hypothetical protein